MALFVIIIIFILIGAGLSWYFISRDHGEAEPIGILWGAVGFGFLGAVLAAIGENVLIPAKYFDSFSQPLAALLIVALAVGFIEEFFKFLPLASYIYPKKYFNEHTDGIIYFALAGLGFGIPENILYAIMFGNQAGVLRIVITPIFHASTTAFVGYYLAKSKVEHLSIRKPAFVLVGAMVLHGLYDFGLMSRTPIFIVMSLMITVILTTLIFILFTRANEIDRALGLSRSGGSNFCRSCGNPNPTHAKYCTHCGKYA